MLIDLLIGKQVTWNTIYFCRKNAFSDGKVITWLVIIVVTSEISQKIDCNLVLLFVSFYSFIRKIIKNIHFYTFKSKSITVVAFLHFSVIGHRFTSKMDSSYTVSIVFLLSLSCYVNGYLRDEFRPPEGDTILFHLGSQLRSWGRNYFSNNYV